VKAALIDAADFYARIVNPWQNSTADLDLSPSLPLLLNDRYGAHFKPEQLLGDPQIFCVLDYASGAPGRASVELTFTPTRAGTAHGICLWFETRLFADIGYSTEPGATDSVYSQILLPWLSPVTLQPAEEVRFQLRADLIGSDYVWQWNTSIAAQQEHEAIHYRQSTFHGSHLSPRFLRSHSADFTPELSPEGQADLFLLQSMTGTTTLRAIAESATRRFPQVFASTEAAFDRAATLAEKLAR